MALVLYKGEMVVDPSGKPLPNVTGKACLTQGGDAIVVYDPVTNVASTQLTSNSYGYCPDFMADQNAGPVWIDFGVWALEVWPRDSLANAANVPALTTRVQAVEQGLSSIQGTVGGAAQQPVVDLAGALAAYAVGKGA